MRPTLRFYRGAPRDGTNMLPLVEGSTSQGWCTACHTSGLYTAAVYVLRDDGPERVGDLSVCITCIENEEPI